MLKPIMILSAGVSVLISCRNKSANTQRIELTDAVYTVSDKHVTTKPDTERKQTLPEDFSIVNLDSLQIINKMAYATTDNFTHQKLYPCATCLLRDDVASALMKAQQLAKASNCKLVIFDCYRPYSIQVKMYEIIKNPDYVAHPGKGSNHNKGCAVDVSLADSNGMQLDMGTPFDDFSQAATYAHVALDSDAGKNRKLLRTIMQEAGFKPYEKEWWHFNYANTNFTVQDFTWSCPK